MFGHRYFGGRYFGLRYFGGGGLSVTTVSSVLWSAFYDEILPVLNGVTPALVDSMLREVSIEFCRKTCLHSAEVDLIDVSAGVNEYTLTSSVSGTQVAMVKAAWFNGTPLSYIPLEILNQSNPYWPSVTGTEARYYTHRQPGSLLLFPVPDTDASGALRVETILVPTLDATGLTEWIATKYHYELACGAKGRLQMQPARPWTDLEQAQVNLAYYRAAITRATIDTSRGQTRSPISVRMRPAA